MKFLETFLHSQGYRPDVDGMRAFAVLAVVLFHTWPGKFGFGIFGVDIFFVISGYLITGIIIRDMNAGHFSFRQFYQRRVLRILPPLLVILAFCLAAGYFLLTAEEYKRLAGNIRAGAFFGGNFFLMAEAGYFDISSSLKPLLHLWSLGIEEQFYFIYPILLLLSAKFSLKIFVVVLIGGISLLFGVQLSDALFSIIGGGVEVRYYSPLVRAFDLCAGALLALIKRRPAPRNGTPLAIAGLLLIVISCFVVDPSQPWPSLLTLLPVGGTALLILAGPHNPVSHLVLANPAAVLLGLISYELYLWHWPLLAFANILAGGPEHVPASAKFALLAAALILSFLFFYFLNLPLRKKFRKNGTVGVILLCLLLGAGLAGHLVFKKNGLPARVEAAAALKPSQLPSVKEDMARAAMYYPEWKEWTDAPNHAALQAAPELTDIAIIGDSHAHHLYGGLAELAAGKNVAVFAASGQAPFLGIATGTQNMTNFRKNGYRLIERAYQTVLDTPRIKTVFLAHYPGFSINGAVDPYNTKDTDNNAIVERAMRKSLKSLQKAGKKVIIVLDNPTLNFNPVLKPVPFSLTRREKMHRREAEASNRARNWYNALCEKLAAEFDNVRLVDLYDTFCDEEYCYAFQDGKPLYTDRNHLSVTGSRLAAKTLLKAIGEPEQN